MTGPDQDAVLRAIRAAAGTRRFDYLVIHTAGAPDGRDQNAAAIRRYHVQHNGWRDIGYNFVVRKDGTVELGRPLAEIPAHVAGFNDFSIGVCFTGNGDLSDFTLAQYDSGVALVRLLQTNFCIPTEHVLGHRETVRAGAPPTPKTCPGKLVDMDRFRARLVAAP